MTPTQPAQVLALARNKGLFRTKDIDMLGIPRAVLRRLVDQGALLHIARGLYAHPNAPITRHHTLVEVAVRVPGAVINLLSALTFHELTNELPHAVWVALQRGRQTPKLDGPALELTRTAERLMHIGVTQHTIEGVGVAITDPTRTVVDCFRFRNRVGLDVAIAALRDYLSVHRSGRDALWRMAGVCRIQTVLRPYLEVLS